MNKLIKYLIENGYQWATEQQKNATKDVRVLSEEEKKLFTPYFGSKILSNVTVDYVDFIENPPFYSGLKELGIDIPLDFSSMAGITFINRIVLSRKRMDTIKEKSILFHELVHVIQYNLLGVRRFIELYIMGWADNGFDYYKIPLEEQAYKLQAKYDSNSAVFSVEDILKKEIL